MTIKWESPVPTIRRELLVDDIGLGHRHANLEDMRRAIASLYPEQRAELLSVVLDALPPSEQSEVCANCEHEASLHTKNVRIAELERDNERLLTTLRNGDDADRAIMAAHGYDDEGPISGARRCAKERDAARAEIYEAQGNCPFVHVSGLPGCDLDNRPPLLDTIRSWMTERERTAKELEAARADVESLRANLDRVNSQIAKAMGYLNPVTGGDIDGIVGRAKAARAEVADLLEAVETQRSRAVVAEELLTAARAEVERMKGDCEFARGSDGAELRRLRSECDRMCPACEAAVDLAKDGYPVSPQNPVRCAFVDAVDNYRAAKPDNAPPPNRFDCPDCGTAVKADEDGCCATCGRDCAVYEDGECVVAPPPDGAPRRVWCEPESDTGWACEVGGWTHDKQFKHAVEYIRFDAYQTAIETARREALERAAERGVEWLDDDDTTWCDSDPDDLRDAILGGAQ